MQLCEQGAVRFYTFTSFPNGELTHAVFGRAGGVSPAPYDSLNMSISTGDSLENVRENRRLALAAAGVKAAAVATLWQVHGTDVVAVSTEPGDPLTQADALITNARGVTLFLRFADCVPILLFDPVRRVTGIAHAGWRGTVAGMAQSVVRAMIANYGCAAADILAGVGPAVGPARYEVGADVVQAARVAFPLDAGFVEVRGGKSYFDLWSANAAALRAAGVRSLEVANLCTAENKHEFFSHRGDGGQSGRFGALIGMGVN